MLLLLAFCSLLILLITLLPLSRNPHWIIRGMDFPRLQWSVFAGVLLIADFIFLDTQTLIAQGLIGVAIICLARQLWWVLPYTLLWPKEVKASCNDHSDVQLSILTSNVLTSNRRANALIEQVRKHQPDILVTLESDQWWQDQLSVLETDMPFSVKCPLDNLYGMHVYSRLPLSEQEVCYLVEDDVPSIHALIELRTGDKVRAHFLHPSPPSPTENPESEERDAELIIVARSVAESDQAVIVAGDLNDVAWSPTTRLFRKISGLLDPRVGRGVFNTFHANYFLIRWPLDHLFHSQDFTLKAIQRLPSVGSDHFPLLARLSYTPARSGIQDGIEADASDHQWAKDIARKQEVHKNNVPNPGESARI